MSEGVVVGGGVTLDGLQSVRDELLNLQIQQQTSQQSSADTQSSSLQQIQAYFSTTGDDIASALTAFSNQPLATFRKSRQFGRPAGRALERPESRPGIQHHCERP